MASGEVARLTSLVKEQTRKRPKAPPPSESEGGTTAAQGSERPGKRRKERWAPEDRGRGKSRRPAAEGPADSPVPVNAANGAAAAEEREEGEREEEEGAAGLTPLLVPAGAHPLRRGKEPTIARILPRWVREPVRFCASLEEVGEAEGAGAGGCPFAAAGLDPGLAAALRRDGVTRLFPVQRAVIPRLLRGAASPVHPGDVCVSAPTGSGKTLAYVLPIVQLLAPRAVRRLRAVVVLPNRDLVGQVKRVFDLYAAAAVGPSGGSGGGLAGRPGLRVAGLSGQTSFAKEQALLCTAVDGSTGASESKVDVVVATPGRLVDHIRGTAGLTMEHVSVLVVDEADRLLSQSYSEWLPTFLAAAHREDPGHTAVAAVAGPLAPFASRPFAVGRTYRRPTGGVRASERTRTGCWLQKLLFSATLSHDPEQLASLQLVLPTLFVADGRLGGPGGRRRAGAVPTDEGEPVLPTGEGVGKGTGDGEDKKDEPEYTVPETLSEHMVVCGAQHKPLVVLYFLLVRRLTRVLVFVASREAARRLAALLNFYDGVACEEFSSTLTSAERRGIIVRFNSDDLNVVVCSDAMARGMDLGRVETVISYDPPVAAQTYVHRVGRTARAGAPGTSYVLLRRQEVLHFKRLHRAIGDRAIPTVTLKPEDYDAIPGDYEAALAHLKRQVQPSAEGTKAGRMAAVHESLARRARKRLDHA